MLIFHHLIEEEKENNFKKISYLRISGIACCKVTLKNYDCLRNHFPQNKTEIRKIQKFKV